MASERALSRDEQAARIKKCFDDGVQYQQQMRFTTAFPQYVNFYEGRQWPKVVKGTENMPRPVLNFTKMICRNKKSAILSVPGRIVYHAENDSPRVQKFNRFATYMQKEMRQDALDSEAIHAGTVKGSYCYHYFWDGSAKGLDATMPGALRCEVLDTLKVFFANPSCRDEQKQKWILIASREEVESVRASADEDVDLSAIGADENSENHYGETEQGKDKLCTVLTRYFRAGGKVYWERATKSVLINEARPLRPDVTSAMRAQGIEEPMRDENEELQADAELYPIVMGSYEPREGSIYGLGEVEGIIPNQRIVNLLIAMSSYNVQQLAWGKYITIPGALGNQTITNEPGQILVDYTKTGSGIRKMQEQTLQSLPLEIVNSLVNLTRSATGATEVMTGETVGSNMSGAAIAALQSQAQQPVEELREAFWDVKVKQGLVLAQFFKHYYQNAPFTYTETDAQGGEERVLEDTFNGTEYKDLSFDVAVEAVKGSKSSNAGDINMLDALLAKGAINPETYVNIYPEDSISNKTAMLEAIRAEREGELSQLRAASEQAAMQVQQLQAELATRQKAFDAVQSTVKENQALKEQLAEVYALFNALRAEAAQKIQQANAVIEKLTADGMEVAHDAQEMAMALAGRQGQSPLP